MFANKNFKLYIKKLFWILQQCSPTVIWLDDLLQINSVIIWISGTWLEKEKANFLSNLVYIKSRLLHLKSQQELNFIDLDSDSSGVEHNTTS
jgi:hypothetical protein